MMPSFDTIPEELRCIIVEHIQNGEGTSLLPLVLCYKAWAELFLPPQYRDICATNTTTLITLDKSFNAKYGEHVRALKIDVELNRGPISDGYWHYDALATLPVLMNAMDNLREFCLCHAASVLALQQLHHYGLDCDMERSSQGSSKCLRELGSYHRPRRNWEISLSASLRPRSKTTPPTRVSAPPSGFNLSGDVLEHSSWFQRVVQSTIRRRPNRSLEHS